MSAQQLPVHRLSCRASPLIHKQILLLNASRLNRPLHFHRPRHNKASCLRGLHRLLLTLHALTRHKMETLAIRKLIPRGFNPPRRLPQLHL
jgi:hypothetical protein